MKTLNGRKALKMLKSYIDEDYSGENFSEINKNLKSNSQTFDIQVLVSDDEETFFDYRIYDPYRHYSNTGYVQSNGYTHWQLESEQVREYEELN